MCDERRAGRLARTPADMERARRDPGLQRQLADAGAEQRRRWRV